MSKNRKSLAPGTLLAPIPPAMVTVGDFDNANVLTIAWTGILNSHPPRTYVSIRPSRHSYGMLREGGEFVINLPSVDLAREVDYVGIYTGAKVDKFEKCNLTKLKSDKVAPPIIAECPIALECRVCEVVPMGSHDVFIADILGISCDDSLFDSEGKLHFENANLLAYAHGQYYSLGEIVGRFGFSTDRDKKTAAAKKTEKPASKVGEKAKPPKKTDEKAKSPKKADEKAKTLVRDTEKTEKKPFYKSAPKGKNVKKRPTDKNKGAPHGRRSVKK